MSTTNATGRVGLAIELLVVLILLAQSCLVVVVVAGLLSHGPSQGTPQTGAEPQAMAPIAHPPAPSQDPQAARADACQRFEGLLRSLDGPLIGQGEPAALGDSVIARLVSETSCRLDDPEVRRELERVRGIYERAGLEPPPILPQVEG